VLLINYTEVGENHVKEIIRFLNRLGFKDVDGGKDFLIGRKQVDACGCYEDTILIIECTTQKNINSKIDNFRGRISNIIKGFQIHEIYKKYNKYKVILAIKKVRKTEKNIQHASDQTHTKVYIWDSEFIRYYEDLQKTIKEYAIYNLLAEIEVKPVSSERISVSTLFTYVGSQKKNLLFLFFIEAKTLLKIAYVARREIGNEDYYQRMITKSRLTEIADYINKGNVFPNTVVISLNNNSWNMTKKTNITKHAGMAELTLLNDYRSCWIIDGQHRLYSYALTTGKGIVSVSAFGNLDPKKQADYFIKINTEAKQVNKNLLWDIVGSLSRGSLGGIISNAVKRLRKEKDGFFENDIKIPSLGRSGKFSLNNICYSIEKNGIAEEYINYLHGKIPNPLYNKNPNTFIKNISKGLGSYFKVFNDGLREEASSSLYSDGIIAVMISIYKFVLAYLKRIPRDTDLIDILKPLLEEINNLDDKDIRDIKKSLTSEASRSSYRNYLIKIIQIEYNKEFAKGITSEEDNLVEEISLIEIKLKEFVNKILKKKYDPEWYKKEHIIKDSKMRKKILNDGERRNQPAWSQLGFTPTIEIITDNKLWNDIFKNIFMTPKGFPSKEVLIGLCKMMWEYRSTMYGHTQISRIIYSKQQREIIKNTFQILNSIIEDKNNE